MTTDWFNTTKQHRSFEESVDSVIVTEGVTVSTGTVTEDTSIVEYSDATAPIDNSGAAAMVVTSKDSLDNPSWGMTF